MSGTGTQTRDGLSFNLASMTFMSINLLSLSFFANTLTLFSSAQQNGFSFNNRPPGVYNSSSTPDGLPWNTYNYCNAPHVNPSHYKEPINDARLVHVIAVMRHHKVRAWCQHLSISVELEISKRTPDNLYPDENSLNSFSGWDCTDIRENSYAGGTAKVFHETEIPTWHPYLRNIWNGTCDAGQLTAGGLKDALQHGKVL